VVDIMVDVFPKYTFTKSGTYYFSKTVPRDLRRHYTRHRIVICLKTKSRHKADISSKTLLSKLENYWLGLRLTHSDIPAQHLLSANPSQESDAPTLIDALDLYLKVKSSGRSKYFNTTARRNIDLWLSDLRLWLINLRLTSSSQTSWASLTICFITCSAVCLSQTKMDDSLNHLLNAKRALSSST